MKKPLTVALLAIIAFLEVALVGCGNFGAAQAVVPTTCSINTQLNPIGADQNEQVCVTISPPVPRTRHIDNRTVGDSSHNSHVPLHGKVEEEKVIA